MIKVGLIFSHLLVYLIGESPEDIEITISTVYLIFNIYINYIYIYFIYIYIFKNNVSDFLGCKQCS